MKNIVQLNEYRKKKEKEQFLARGRSPLYKAVPPSQEDLAALLSQLNDQVDLLFAAYGFSNSTTQGSSR